METIAITPTPRMPRQAPGVNRTASATGAAAVGGVEAASIIDDLGAWLGLPSGVSHTVDEGLHQIPFVGPVLDFLGSFL